MPEGSIIPLKSIYCERLGFTIWFVNTDRKSVDGQAMANARLIAAAPDMLAVLGHAQTLNSFRAVDDYLPTMRAAIAKATGAST